MKKVRGIFFLILVLYIVLQSCAPAYVPNTMNTPLFENKNEFKATINGGFNGGDAQFAYTPINHLGIMLNGSFMNNNDSNSYHRHTFGEFGVGYYNAFGIGRFEVYGGYGLGSVDSYFKNELFNSKAQATYHRIFIQPSIGISSDFADFSFTPRFVLVNMHLNSTTLEGFNTGRLDPFFEPAITARFGYKYVKFFMQFGLSVPLIDKNEYIYDYEPFILAFGIHLTIADKYFHKKKESNDTDK